MKQDIIKTDENSQSLNNNWVTTSNGVARAAQCLSISEKRLVMAAVSKLDSMKSLKQGECPCVRLSAKEYAETFEVDSNTAYTQLKTASKALYNRSILLFEPSNRRNGKALITTQMHWVGEIKYHEKEGWVELHFWHKLVPHLIGLKKCFTTYKLKQASSLRSIYSWRLLELLTTFESNGWAQFDVKDFEKSMDVPPFIQNNFRELKRKIIVPAVKELTIKDNWIINFNLIKRGRTVVSIRFDFSRNPQGRLL